MKRNVLLIACFLCHIGIQAQINHTVTFEPGKLIIDNQTREDGNVYANLSYEDCSVDDSVGAPSLPYRILRFIVPNEPVSFSIDIDVPGSTRINLPAPLLAVQPPVPTSGNKAENGFIAPSLVSFRAYPEKVVQIINEGYLDGDKRILTVKVTPVQYVAASNQLLFHSSVGFTINYNNVSSKSSERRMSPIVSPPRESAELMQMLDFVENKSDISRILSSRSQVRATISSLNLPAYEYVVITSRSLAPYFKRLVDWKRQKGLNAGIVTMQDILGDASITKDEASNLSDDAGKLRQYLRLAYDRGTRYVLLGGRREFVPIRYGTEKLGKENIQIPSDLYFSDLNGNWNRDGDSDLGEESDRLDYDPELYVGRLLCRDGQEINNYIDKLLLYEQNPGKGNYAYLKKALYMESDWMQYTKEGESVSNEFKDIFPSITMIKEYPDSLQSIPTYPTGKDVIEAMNSEFHGFISWFAHGSPSGVKAKSNGDNNSGHYLVNAREGVYPAPWNEVETGNGLDNLINFNYPSVLYSIACNVVPYDVYVDGSVTYDMKYNVGESFTVGGKYGGVAFLGNTREGWTGNSMALEKKFVNRIKFFSGKIGKAEAFSKADYKGGDFHWLALTHNLIGCPEFEMWTNIPSRFTNASITKSSNGLTVNAGVDGTNISLKGLFNDQRIYSLIGRTVTFYPLSQNYVLTLYKHDYIPYVAPIYLQNESVNGTHYVKGSQITTGNSVDSTKANGDFVVKSGSDIVLEVSDGITLDAGTEIELGASFEIKMNK